MWGGAPAWETTMQSCCAAWAACASSPSRAQRCVGGQVAGLGWAHAPCTVCTAAHARPASQALAGHQSIACLKPPLPPSGAARCRMSAWPACTACLGWSHSTSQACKSGGLPAGHPQEILCSSAQMEGGLKQPSTAPPTAQRHCHCPARPPPCSDAALGALLRRLPLLRRLCLERCSEAGDEALAAVGQHVRRRFAIALSCRAKTPTFLQAASAACAVFGAPSSLLQPAPASHPTTPTGAGAAPAVPGLHRGLRWRPSGPGQPHAGGALAGAWPAEPPGRHACWPCPAAGPVNRAPMLPAALRTPIACPIPCPPAVLAEPRELRGGGQRAAGGGPPAPAAQPGHQV